MELVVQFIGHPSLFSVVKTKRELITSEDSATNIDIFLLVKSSSSFQTFYAELNV